MTARDVVTIAAKLVGLYVLMLTVSKIPTLSLYLTRMPARSVFDRSVDWYTLAVGIEFVVFLAAGIGFFAGARAWSARLFPDTSAAPATPLGLGERFEAVALSVAGVVILARVFPKLVSATYGLAMLARTGRTDPAVEMLFGPNASPAALIELAATVVVGLWLALGSHGLANVVRRFRDGGWPRGRGPEEEQV